MTAPIDIACDHQQSAGTDTVCGAKPGEPCRRQDGKNVWWPTPYYHRERIDAAARLADERLDAVCANIEAAIDAAKREARISCHSEHDRREILATATSPEGEALIRAMRKRTDALPGVTVRGFPGVVTQEQADEILARERASRARPFSYQVEAMRNALVWALDNLEGKLIDQASRPRDSGTAPYIDQARADLAKLAELRRLVKP